MLRDFEKKHGAIVEGYINLTSVNGVEITLDCRKFEDGFLIGFSDEAIFYGRTSVYNWNNERDTFEKAE